jgi:hypothetical protein
MSGYTAILLAEPLDGDTSEAIARILGRPIVGFYTITADGGGGGEYAPHAQDANGIALDVAEGLYRIAGSANAAVASSEAELLIWARKHVAEIGNLCAGLQNTVNEGPTAIYDAVEKVREIADELSFGLESYDAAQ